MKDWLAQNVFLLIELWPVLVFMIVAVVVAFVRKMDRHKKEDFE
jgi:hypothetical protein